MMFYDAGTDYFEMDAWEMREQKEVILKALKETGIWEKLYELGVQSIDFTDLRRMTLTVDVGAGFSYKVKVREDSLEKGGYREDE